MNNLKEQLIQDLYDFNVSADISIESLADTIINTIQKTNGQTYAEEFHCCPMCIDCPDNCPMEK